MLIGFNVLSIRAKHKASEREAAVNAFNDKENPVQVLVTSLKVSSTSINLQKDCADEIFVDVPSNAQAAQQAAGRVIRLGQLNGRTIYIITTDHSYDQALQAAAARKMLGVIASYTGMKVSDADIEAERQSHPEDSEEDIKARLIDESCAEDYRLMFGQRSRREEWHNVADPTEKDSLPIERAFRDYFHFPVHKFMQPQWTREEKAERE